MLISFIGCFEKFEPTAVIFDSLAYEQQSLARILCRRKSRRASHPGRATSPHNEDTGWLENDDADLRLSSIALEMTFHLPSGHKISVLTRRSIITNAAASSLQPILSHDGE
jgi:hypothetical protein